MNGVSLYDYQEEALHRMRNGCVLCGGVGSGKSRTGLAYYYTLYGGKVNTSRYVKMTKPDDLYIITTARKRDTGEWEEELANFYLSTNKEIATYKNTVIVDSWNNIKKYEKVKESFFIFDEQRVVGDGAWSSSFVRIAKANRWILLSATPGDCWMDYMSVFIANGFYRNKTEFKNEHVIYTRFLKYPKIDRYIDLDRLVELRNQILVTMDFNRQTVRHHENIYTNFDRKKYMDICRTRWNPYTDEPISNASEFCTTLRKVVNTDPSKTAAVIDICARHPRVIIFYNFDYELDALKSLYFGKEVEVAEWNGHRHMPVPDTERWVYLVQYNAGAEGWNCTKTDTILFYSPSYSYKVMEQAAGRIDRLNTRYHDLYYYHLKSRSGIDLAIAKALTNKKNFNEGKFYYG